MKYFIFFIFFIVYCPIFCVDTCLSPKNSTRKYDFSWLNKDGSIDIYCDFEETITLSYEQQTTTMDKILEESLKKESDKMKFREKFALARKKYKQNPSEASYRDYFKAFGKGILTLAHCEKLANSWSINPNFINAIEKIRESSGAKKLNITVVGRGFTQPFQMFLEKQKNYLNTIGINVVGYRANTLIFNKNGIYTGEIESPVVINKDDYVPIGSIFLGDKRDRGYFDKEEQSDYYFVDVNNKKNVDNIPNMISQLKKEKLYYNSIKGTSA